MELRLSDIGVALAFIALVSIGGPLLMLIIGSGPSLLRAFRDRYFISSSGDERGADDDLIDAEQRPFLSEKRNGETNENGVATGKIEGSNQIQFPDGFTMLARLVLAEKLGETDALKLAVKVSPGKSPRYLEARARLHAALERERPPAGPRFVEYDEEGRPRLDESGQLVTTIRRSSSP